LFFSPVSQTSDPLLLLEELELDELLLELDELLLEWLVELLLEWLVELLLEWLVELEWLVVLLVVWCVVLLELLELDELCPLLPGQSPCLLCASSP
jgi:hypothetical protein